MDYEELPKDIRDGLEKIFTKKNIDNEDNKNKKIVIETLCEIEKIKEPIKSLDINDVRKYVSEYMEFDVKELIDNFNKEFKNIPDNDIIKKQVLLTLGELGIYIEK